MSMVYNAVEQFVRGKERDLNLDDEYNLNFDISDFKDIEEILRDITEEEERQENGEDRGGNVKREKLSSPTLSSPTLSSPTSSSPKKENRYKLVTRRIDNGRIRHKTAKTQEVYTSVLKNVKMEVDGPTRSGVIIFTKKDGKTYFALGVDSIYGDLTDFSGGVRCKCETILEGGLRELEEESLGVFGKLSVEDVKECMGFYSNNMLIMFVKRDIDMEECKKTFGERLQKKMCEKKNDDKDGENIEVNQIVFLDTKEFLDSIQGRGRRLYSRVRRILSKVVEVIAAI